VEVVEHIHEMYADNYIATMRRAKFVIFSHAGKSTRTLLVAVSFDFTFSSYFLPYYEVWGGWHHVAVRDEWYWIALMETRGFRLMVLRRTNVASSNAHRKNNF
jgi:hypothetical protein